MRGVTSVAGILMVVVVVATPAVAAPALPQDECDDAPRLVNEIDPVDPDNLGTPVFINGRVWFGGSIYLPDGTFLRSSPADGFPRGEDLEFSAEVIGYDDIEWGVASRSADDGQMSVFTPDGEVVAEVPVNSIAEAVYDDGFVLVAEAVKLTNDSLSVFLVDEEGTVLTLPVAVAEENNRFGAVVEGSVFILQEDGSIGRFDTRAQRLGTIRGPAGEGFQWVFAAHGFGYALTEWDVDGSRTLVVLDPDATVVNSVRFGPGSVEIRPTERGIAYAHRLTELVEVGGQQSQEPVEQRFGLLSPTGNRIGTMTGSIGSPLDDTIFKAHGRYVLFNDFVSEYQPDHRDDAGDIPTITSRMALYLADGTSLSSTQEITYSAYGFGRPAGKLIAFYGPDGRSVEFRSLSGSLVSSTDFGLGDLGVVELAVTDHHHVWVVTEEYDSFDLGGSSVLLARVFDLGSCAGLPTSGSFIDDDRSVFESDIEWLAATDITRGCDPGEGNTRFCPDDPITRGQMAAFLHRSLGEVLEPGGEATTFDDATDSVFADDILWLSSVGVTDGCAPDRFCPDDPVTRGQMAAFLVRALRLPPASTSPFDDTTDSVFADDIARLAGSGITRGCTDSSFCPDAHVSRGQLAAFLRRGLA